MIVGAVDTNALWQMAAAALVAGVGITTIFSFAILGASRASEANRRGRPSEAAMFGVFAGIGLLATVAALGLGIIVIASK